jgi:hypothetical protein
LRSQNATGQYKVEARAASAVALCWMEGLAGRLNWQGRDGRRSDDPGCPYIK